MYLVADFGTNGADSSATHQVTGVAVVPVLVAVLFLGHCEGAQFAVQSLSLLREGHTERERRREGKGEGEGEGERERKLLLIVSNPTMVIYVQVTDHAKTPKSYPHHATDPTKSYQTLPNYTTMYH